MVILMTSSLLLRQANFRRLLLANFLSGVGDWFNSVAVLSLLLEITGTAMAVGITLALRTLPYLVFGPLGGLLADRFNRKAVMIACDLVRAVIALSFLFVSSADDVWIVYAGTFALVAFSALYNPARISLIPDVVERDQLLSANALEESVFGIVMAAGSLVGGVFAAYWGTDAAFVCNSLSFVLSAALILRISLPPRSSGVRREADKEERKANEPSYRDLFSLIRQTPLVLYTLLMTTLWPVGGGILNVLISVYAYQVFAAGKSGVGLLYGAIGLGFIVGGVAADLLKRRPYHMASCSFAVEGFAHVLTSFAPTIYLAAACYALSTVAGGMGNASLRTLLMRHLDKAYHGRVFALQSTISSVLIGLSMLVGGWLLTVFEPRLLGFAAGLLITLCSLIIGVLILQASRAADSAAPAQPD